MRSRGLLWRLFGASVSTLFVVNAVRAEESTGGSGFRVWLNPGVYSYHFDRNKDLRENNSGFGAEVLLAEDHALMAGTFINSDRARSHYAAYQWRPLHWSPHGIGISAGLAVGAFDGYQNYRDGAWFPAVLPMLAVEGRYVGVNLFIVPTIADRLDGALAVQIKLRIW